MTQTNILILIIIMQLRKFMDSKSASFGDRDEKEHKLEYTSIHQEYVALIEETIAAVLKTHKYTMENFYKVCKDAEAKDASIKIFVELLLSASDYVLFVDLMRDPDKRRFFFNVVVDWRRSFNEIEEEKGEFKGK
jgi:hypothetical protein